MARARRFAIVLTALTAALVGWQAIGGPGADPIRQAAASALGPIERAVGPRDGELSSAQARSAELLAENADLRARLAEALGTPKTSSYAAGRRVVVARVVGRDDGGRPGRVTIDVGRADGVRLDTTVVAAAGLVGRIRSVAASTAEVQLIGDRGSSVGVRVGSAGRLGSVTGSGGSLRLEMLDAGPVAVGDAVSTLGSVDDHPFVPGIPIGRVGSLDPAAGSLTARGAVTPLADPATLDVLAVLVDPA